MEPVERVRVRAWEGNAGVERADSLAVEEPLEIRTRPAGSAKAASFVVTMRTPGHDEEHVAGLLFAEAVLRSRSDLISLDRPADRRIDPSLTENVMIATLGTEAHERASRLRRGTIMGSACGVCGKTSIENVISDDLPPLSSSFCVSPEFLYSLPALVAEHQSVFAQTGGLHAAAIFGADGRMGAIREDIGRHNAVDKLVGAFFLRGELPLSDSVLMVSGRAGFEIAQKAFAAGVPILAAVSAPSSLAVELAETAGLTLIGFLRNRRFNIYSNPQRVRSSA